CAALRESISAIQETIDLCCPLNSRFGFWEQSKQATLSFVHLEIDGNEPFSGAISVFLSSGFFLFCCSDFSNVFWGCVGFFASAQARCLGSLCEFAPLPSKMSSTVALRSIFMDGGCFSRFQDEAKLLKARKMPVRCSVISAQKLDKSIRVGILGASGYTGAENNAWLLLCLQDLPDLVAVKDADFSSVEAVFCCLPHGTTQEIIKGLPTNLKIVDLSADFRLRDINDYGEWYGQPHRASELQKEAVYGLTEIYRNKIQSARLVANPGCYPTTILLPLIPLLKVLPEIEQELSDAANSRVTVSFTPTLMPMSRGMQSTINVQMAPGVSVEDLKQQLTGFYEKEEFVVVLPNDAAPHTKYVQGSNGCHINVFPDRIPGRAIIISVIDNLVKGASGQALQNLNLMMGIPENTGLSCMPLFP
ncbi:N-acetyl-gamma-glutamyl-phosphate reductase, active site-containing protein, partial [Cynara cardunculus var. scolymus]